MCLYEYDEERQREFDREEGREEGRDAERIAVARRMLKSHKLSYVEVAEFVGLTVEEVKALMQKGCTRDMISMQGLGYKEIIAALEGKITIEEAFEQIKKETRHFAKRQFTWFRREKEVTWLQKEKFASEEELLQYCIADCNDLVQNRTDKMQKTNDLKGDRQHG